MRALVVYNAYSGRSALKNKISRVIEPLARLYEIKLFESLGPRAITSYIAKKGMQYDLVIVCGGDGTAHEAINGIMQLDKRPRLAIIPMGTCNDFAKSLGYSKSINKCLKIIEANEAMKIDISKINDSYFNYGLAAGALTEISYQTTHKSKLALGRLSYYLNVLARMRSKTTLDLKMSVDGAIPSSYSLSILLATNSRYLAGFRLKRKNKIYLNDNTLQLMLIHKRGRLMTVLLFARALFFGEFKSRSVEFMNASRLTIEANSEINYNTDGELFTDRCKIEVEVLRDALEVIVNPRLINKCFIGR